MKRFFLACLLCLLCAAPATAMELTVSVSHFRPTFTGEYMAGNLLDNDPTTVWASNAHNSGIGAWFNIAFPTVVALRTLTIYNGHQGGRYAEFSRIQSGRLKFSDGSEQHFTLNDESGPQTIPCWTVPTKEITVEVDSIYPAEQGKSVSLAVSGVKLVLMGGADAPAAMAEEGALGELTRVIRNFYTYQTTLNDKFLQCFPKEKQEEEEFGFEVFKQMQKQQGTDAILRRSIVDMGNLKFRLMRYEAAEALVHSFGHYTVIWKENMTPIPDDSVFTLRKEDDGWKIFEVRDYAAPK